MKSQTQAGLGRGKFPHNTKWGRGDHGEEASSWLRRCSDPSGKGHGPQPWPSCTLQDLFLEKDSPELFYCFISNTIYLLAFERLLFFFKSDIDIELREVGCPYSKDISYSNKRSCLLVQQCPVSLFDENCLYPCQNYWRSFISKLSVKESKKNKH